MLVPLRTLETLLVPEQEGLLLGFGSWFSGHQERDLLETVPAALADWTQVPADTVDKPVEIETCGLQNWFSVHPGGFVLAPQLQNCQQAAPDSVQMAKTGSKTGSRRLS